jgi:hypothetical protein
MLTFLKRLLGGGDRGLRKVPGALSVSDASGGVVYNMLDPWMQKFMGQCVSALKNAGIKAKGTGSFSIRIGEDGKKELPLDSFWSRYAESQNAGEFDAVVSEAKRLLSE